MREYIANNGPMDTNSKSGGPGHALAFAFRRIVKFARSNRCGRVVSSSSRSSLFIHTFVRSWSLRYLHLRSVVGTPFVFASFVRNRSLSSLFCLFRSVVSLRLRRVRNRDIRAHYVQFVVTWSVSPSCRSRLLSCSFVAFTGFVDFSSVRVLGVL